MSNFSKRTKRASEELAYDAIHNSKAAKAGRLECEVPAKQTDEFSMGKIDVNKITDHDEAEIAAQSKGWTAFGVQKPNNGQMIVVADFVKGSIMIMNWDDNFSHLITENDFWISAPTLKQLKETNEKD